MSTLEQKARAMVIALRAHGRCYDMPGKPRCNRCEYCRQHLAADIIAQLLLQPPKVIEKIVYKPTEAVEPESLESDESPPPVPVVEPEPQPSVVSGRWALLPHQTIYDNVRLTLTKQQSFLLYNVASSEKPRAAKQWGLAISMKKQSQDPAALFFVHYYRIIHVLRDMKIKMPILKTGASSTAEFGWDRSL